jgi:hypothetical protein
VMYVSVEHEPGIWMDAHVEDQWKRHGRWQVSVYYFVRGLEHHRVCDFELIRWVSSVELQDHEQRSAIGCEPTHAEHERRVAIDFRRNNLLATAPRLTLVPDL